MKKRAPILQTCGMPHFCKMGALNNEGIYTASPSKGRAYIHHFHFLAIIHFTLDTELYHQSFQSMLPAKESTSLT